MGEALGGQSTDQRRFAIGASILHRDIDRDRIDVGRQNLVAPQLGGADRQQAGAAAEVEHVAIAVAAREIAQGGEAQRRGLVMAGAERHAGLDPHRDDAVRHLAGIVRAINEEASGADGRQTFLGEADPILIGEGLDRDGAADKRREEGFAGQFGVERFDGGVGLERLLVDQDRDGRWRRQFERRGDIARQLLRQRDMGFPQGGIGRHGRAYSGGMRCGTGRDWRGRAGE